MYLEIPEAHSVVTAFYPDELWHWGDVYKYSVAYEDQSGKHQSEETTFTVAQNKRIVVYVDSREHQQIKGQPKMDLMINPRIIKWRNIEPDRKECILMEQATLPNLYHLTIHCPVALRIDDINPKNEPVIIDFQ